MPSAGRPTGTALPGELGIGSDEVLGRDTGLGEGQPVDQDAVGSHPPPEQLHISPVDRFTAQLEHPEVGKSLLTGQTTRENVGTRSGHTGRS